ncbi:MAG: hypothetical protein KAT09_06155 [Candidatus Aegiribacteria sp.]|nr:hypothetical protein [Candidatus Aegiribacteria sp.]
MILCLIIAILNVILVSAESEPVEVHEWGVVIFGEYEPAVTAVPGFVLPPVITDPAFSIMPPSVEAPVIFFHGEEFSGDFVVEVFNANIFDIYPVDGVRSTHDSIRWSDIRVFNPGEGTEYPDIFPAHCCMSDELARSWRTLECNSVRTSGGINEGFLYYECFLENQEFVEYPKLLAAGGGLPEGVDKILIFMRPSDDYQEMYLVDPASLFIPAEIEEIGVYDKAWMLEILFSWNTVGLYPDEIELLWETWEAYVTSPVWEGDALVVFPLPRDMINKISSLEVLPDGEMEIMYRRFFLGMMPVLWAWN